MRQRNDFLLKALPIALGLILAGCNGGGSKVGDGGGIRKGNTLPTVTQVAYSPGDATLKRYSVYTFLATVSDPDIGDTVTKFEWDFGDTGGQTILTTGDGQPQLHEFWCADCQGQGL